VTTGLIIEVVGCNMIRSHDTGVHKVPPVVRHGGPTVKALLPEETVY
jgi:hypothetical protein